MYSNLIIDQTIPERELIQGLIDDIVELTHCELIHQDENQILFNTISITKEQTDISIPWTSYFINFDTNETMEHFKLAFKWYFHNDEFVYSNLICMCMIIKNAATVIEEILTQNIPFFDRWCILDTGSTDGTQDIIKRVLKDKRGELHEEPFVNFKVSRNRCLDLAGKKCKFNIMLDDTYILKGDIRSFLTDVRGDTYSDSFSIMIQSYDNEYYSNRILKSEKELKYIYTIHEVIDDKNNVNVVIPIDRAYIVDFNNETMEKRTSDRKKYDLELLFQEDQNDPRTIYYIAQTYGCMGDHKNKAIYFEKRIKMDGFVQEKIDACFELARTYHFTLNHISLEPLNGILDKVQWDRCEGLYLKAYSMDNKRPDALYFIGIQYYLEKNYPTAYIYFKKAFELGYPVDSQYSLKPTLSFYFLPKFLTEVCYYMENYTLGKLAAQRFLSRNTCNLVGNWFNIHANMELLKVDIPTVLPNTVVIVADGGWGNWSGEDIETKGVGGSETWVIETATVLTKYWNVIVFCRTEKFSYYKNVCYRPINEYITFTGKHIVDHTIISRYTEYVPVACYGHSKKVYLIFHDILQDQTIIPLHPKIECLIGLTNWHADTIKRMFPQFKVTNSYYGIKPRPLKPKVTNSFIYSSFPNRGLSVLLRMWPRIKKVLPDATLGIYCNLEQEWVNRVAKEEMDEIRTLLAVNNKGVTVHGWVSKKVLMDAWDTAEYWLYPCIFEETFCHTAMEAAITKTFVISCPLAALTETVGTRGILIPGNPKKLEWQDQALSVLTKEKKILLEENYQWAMENPWTWNLF